MYLSLNWLKDFVKLPAKIKPEVLAAEITKHTVEVEGLVRQAERFGKVVVGKVLAVKPHPGADRLRLVSVEVKKKNLAIVCGAPNVAVNQLVAVALPGAALPNGLVIKATEIRGENSEGMICAEDELGLGQNHEGIMVLTEKAKVGQPLAEYLSAADVILEVDNKSLSNRPDLWGHYGLAREVAAIFKFPLKPYTKFLDQKTVFLSQKESRLNVKVEDQEDCPRYLAVRIDSLKVSDSPAWLKERLIAVGQRPINNIVDLTNYVMLETGQPLHAFDAGQIEKIVVRRARKKEILETLDEKERLLDDSDIVITDGRTPIALAGIMGGKNSQVTSQTTGLILEAANFSARRIRLTSQRLNLRSEASARFEKSLDASLAESALLRFLKLLKDICPTMKISSALLDIKVPLAAPREISLDLQWLNMKIGQAIPAAEVQGLLESLGFTVAADQPPVLKVTVPSWRATKDIIAREDLLEEVLRLYGYDNIASRLPVMALQVPEVNAERNLERKIKNMLAEKFSLVEAYTYSFLGDEQLVKLSLDPARCLSLANPLSAVQSVLRPSLAPGLIYNLRSNQAKAVDLGFFEIGSVFFKSPGSVVKDPGGATLPHQEKRLAIALACDRGQDLFGRIKSVITNLFSPLVYWASPVEFLPAENVPGWANSRSAAKIILLGKELGLVARLSTAVAENINLKKSTVIAEINFSALLDVVSSQATWRFQEAGKYPPVSRDLAFVVNEKILYNDIKEELLGFDPLLVETEIFDVYSGDKLPTGQKSLAFHLSYQAPDRTLLSEEVDQIQANLVSRLEEKFGAQLRNF